MTHNIKYPVRAEKFDCQYLIKDGNGKCVCNTLTGNDEANAKFIVDCVNKAFEKLLDNDEAKELRRRAK